MAKAHAKLQSMNVDALLKLRDDIGTVLSYKRQELETQLQRLGGEVRRSLKVEGRRSVGARASKGIIV